MLANIRLEGLIIHILSSGLKQHWADKWRPDSPDSSPGFNCGAHKIDMSFLP